MILRTTFFVIPGIPQIGIWYGAYGAAYYNPVDHYLLFEFLYIQKLESGCVRSII